MRFFEDKRRLKSVYSRISITGMKPNMRRKVRLKCDESANPA
jgi:hypothetical protein